MGSGGRTVVGAGREQRVTLHGGGTLSPVASLELASRCPHPASAFGVVSLESRRVRGTVTRVQKAARSRECEFRDLVCLAVPGQRVLRTGQM